jgi:hypothetical protein
MTLEINSCKNYEILEVRQGDKGSRIIDFAFTVNGETVDLASTMSAKVNATVDDVIVADSVAAIVDTENNVVTVTLTDTMLALSGICKMDIVLMEGDEIITAETVCLRIGKSVINDDSKAFPGASSIAEITKEVENARGGSNSLGARLDTADANLTKKANKSDIDSINSRLQSAETTLKNKANTTDVSNSLAKKADKSTTLAGYGITDAYTKEKTDQKLAQKLNSMPFDSEPKNNSPCYLTSGTVYNSLLTKADKTETDNSLGEKADKADVDTSLANKANLINSLNIFDFDAWAKGLQKMNPPVFHGTLDELNFDEKSITITTTEYDGYTNSWKSSSQSSVEAMKISVKPNTKYWISWFTNNYTSNGMVFLNANTETKVIIKNGKGTFITSNDTSFITLRFGSYPTTTFKVSEIMITEKESIYLPNKVAEGVPEVANEVLKFEKTTQTSLDGKYDSANIESGTSKLTPYSTITDKIKSASCTYKTIGDVVIINATITMNAVTIGANSTYPLINLPYKCISVDDVFCVGISNLGKLFKFTVVKNNTWLQFQSQDKTAYTFADGEQINVICSYKIK